MYKHNTHSYNFVQVRLKNAFVQTSGWEPSALRSLAEQHSSVSSGIGTNSSAHSICILWSNLSWFVVVWLFGGGVLVSQRDFLLTADKWQQLKRGMNPLRISVKQWCEVKGRDCLAWTGRISRQAFVFVFWWSHLLAHWSGNFLLDAAQNNKVTQESR